MSFNLHTSNRLELLADRLIERLDGIPAGSGDSLFRKDYVVVQSKGMERWLSLRIAEKRGVSANIEFPFPKSFAYNVVFREALEMSGDMDYFQPDFMAWRIMKALPMLIEKDAEGVFDGPKNYIADDAGGLKLYQLSKRIAGLFDQYIIYRPEMINCGWRHNGYGEKIGCASAAWQRLLFEEISKGHEDQLPSRRLKQFIAKLDPSKNSGGGFSFKTLPPVVSIFGISVLPPFFIDVFKALASVIDVDFYYLSPCMEYWEHIKSAKKISGRELAYGKSAEQLHYETGNDLLASMGEYAQGFFFKMGEDSIDLCDKDLYRESPGDSLLSRLQNDILMMRNPDAEAAKPSSVNIGFSSCYNPMRELEVLHDNLLRIMDEGAPDGERIEPKDIIVLTSDIRAYGPYVQAVFDSPEENRLRIPYSISDSSSAESGSVFKTLMAMLEIHRKRYAASALMDLLQSESLRAKFGFTDRDLESIRTWIAENMIRWGIDPDHRKELDGAYGGFDENTWESGLSRMLLGYALGTEQNDDFFSCAEAGDRGKIFPYAKIEEGDSLVLGKFADFAKKVFKYCSAVEKADMNPAAWRKFLNDMVAEFFNEDRGSAQEIKGIGRAVAMLERYQEGGGPDCRLGPEVIRAYLRDSVSDTKSEGGFINRGVTFCELMPMRGIPFKVVCLMGMGDGSFPRQTKKLGFDVMADNLKPWERDPRKEDKFLFLEAILSARTNLLISYVGRSMADNKDLPPSVLVSELQEYLERQGIPSGDLTVRHPLQAFSARYFDGKSGGRLFSYSEKNFRAACVLCDEDGRTAAPRFWPAGHELPPEDPRGVIRMEELAGFIKHPVRNILKNRLKINLPEEQARLDDNEVFSIGGLESADIQKDLLENMISSGAISPRGELVSEPHFQKLKSRGTMQPAPFDLIEYRGMLNGTSRFLREFNLVCSGFSIEKPSDFLLDLPCGLKLSGNLKHIYSSGKEKRQISYFFSSFKARQLLETWISHLAANAAGLELDTCLLTKNKNISLGAMTSDMAKKILSDLLQVYFKGRSRPLPFFPESSKEYVDAILSGKEASEALAKAKKKWLPGFKSKFSESSDSYNKFCFPEDFFENADYLDDVEEFAEFAEKIYAPISNNFGTGIEAVPKAPPVAAEKTAAPAKKKRKTG